MARVVALSAALTLVFTTTAWGQGPYDDEKTPAGWAWARIRNDEIADFNARCGELLNPHEKKGWDHPCRQMPPKFLVEVLTLPKWSDQVVLHRVRLRGVRIDGNIDLSNAEITSEVWIDVSRIEGHLNLAYSHWGQPFSLRGSALAGELFADGMRAESVIALSDHAAIEGLVDLRGAKVGGDLEMDTSSFAKGVSASSLSVSGNLSMGDHATFGGEINLVDAKVGGILEMDTSSFRGAVIASSLSVLGDLRAKHATFGNEVDLLGASIGSNLDIDSSSFAKTLAFDRLSVGGNLLMRENATFGGDVSLHGAKVDGDIQMITSSFATVTAESLTVGATWS
jgi:hypothetical protein